MHLSGPDSERGSIPLVLLASIVVAGLITVLFAAVLQSQRTTRFDRSFSESLHSADAGFQEAYFQIRNELLTDTSGGALDVGETTDVHSTTDGDTTYRWEVERTEPLEHDVTSTATQGGVSRTVVVTVGEDPLFFPGGFGHSMLSTLGNSSEVDSYESRTPTGSCTPDPDVCWGTDTQWGTGNGALATNDKLDFPGNVAVKQAALFDWEANPGAGVSVGDPGGDRCDNESKDNPCADEDRLLIFDHPLDYSSEEAVQFITDKLERCETETDRELGDLVLDEDAAGFTEPSRSQTVTTEANTLPPYSVDPADNPDDVRRADWDNFWCANRIDVYGDVDLDNADSEHPVVVFVRDAVTMRQQGGGSSLNCDEAADECLDSNWMQDHNRPDAYSLQLYVASNAASSGANVSMGTNSVLNGVVHAPRATCDGAANVHLYGSIVCGQVDNVGNWTLHFDDVLAQYGAKTHYIIRWREDASEELAAP